MASLTDLVNLNLSDCTDKIIAEYIWLASLCSCTANDLNCLKIAFVLYSIFSVVASCIQCLWYPTTWNFTVWLQTQHILNSTLLPISLLYCPSLNIYLMPSLLCRIGGSGIDLRSKARVRSSIHAMSFWIMTYTSSCGLLPWYISHRCVVGADGERPHHQCEPAPKMELRWLQHRAGSRRGQRSHPLVWSSSPCCLCSCFSVYLHSTFVLLLLMRLRLFISLWSPQAIFKDPFRRGDNILVSLRFSYYFTFRLEAIDTARSKKGGRKRGTIRSYCSGTSFKKEVR